MAAHLQTSLRGESYLIVNEHVRLQFYIGEDGRALTTKRAHAFLVCPGGGQHPQD